VTVDQLPQNFIVEVQHPSVVNKYRKTARLPVNIKLQKPRLFGDV